MTAQLTPASHASGITRLGRRSGDGDGRSLRGDGSAVPLSGLPFWVRNFGSALLSFFTLPDRRSPGHIIYHPDRIFNAHLTVLFSARSAPIQASYTPIFTLFSILPHYMLNFSAISQPFSMPQPPFYSHFLGAPAPRLITKFRPVLTFLAHFFWYFLDFPSVFVPPGTVDPRGG